MEPITAAWMMSTLLGGWLGNRADFWLCKGTNQLYSRIKENINEPTNHHIQRAIRKSYLKATLMAVKHIASQRKWYKLSDARWSNIKKVEKYVKNQIDQTGNEKDNVRSSLIDESHRDILFSKDGSSADRMDELINNLKQSIINELEGGRRKVESTLKDCIINGWKEGPKEMNFYKLTCAFFTQELKDNTELSTYIQTEYLDSIQSQLGEVKLTMSILRTTLDLFYEEYKEVLPLLRKISTSLEGVKESLGELPAKTAALVLKEIKENNITPRQISISEEYQQYIADIHTLGEEVQSINQQIAGVRHAIQTVDKSIKPLLQQNIDNLNKQLLQRSGEKNDLEQSLDNFVKHIIQLSKQLNPTPSDLSDGSDRFKKARALFEKGKYSELNEVLNEDEIDKEINLLKSKRNSLARELIIKAQSIVITKPDNWFKEADRLYLKAIDVIKNYENTLKYALYLSEHNKLKEAIEMYKVAINLTSNQAQKSNVLNNIGKLQWANFQTDMAEISYEKSLNISRELSVTNPQIYLPLMAITLNNLGALKTYNNEFDKAEFSYHKSIEIFEKLAKNKNHNFVSKLANTWNNMGLLQDAREEYFKAELAYHKALKHFRDLVKNNSDIYLPNLATTLNNYGVLKYSKKEFKIAEESCVEALNIFRKLANTNPYSYYPDVAMTLINIGLIHNATGSLGKSNFNYQEALNKYQLLAKEDPDTYLPSVATVLHNLGELQIDKSEFSKAESSLKKAMEIRKNFKRTNPKRFDILYADTCVNLSILYKKNSLKKSESMDLALEASVLYIKYKDSVEGALKGYKLAQEIIKFYQK